MLGCNDADELGETSLEVVEARALERVLGRQRRVVRPKSGIVGLERDEVGRRARRRIHGLPRLERGEAGLERVDALLLGVAAALGSDCASVRGRDRVTRHALRLRSMRAALRASRSAVESCLRPALRGAEDDEAAEAVSSKSGDAARLVPRDDMVSGGRWRALKPPELWADGGENERGSGGSVRGDTSTFAMSGASERCASALSSDSCTHVDDD